MALTACQSLPELPKVDLSQPGWTLRQGQAVWHPRRHAPEIAGDLIVASHPDGQAFVQFSKSPLTLVSAEKTAYEWQVEFPLQDKRYAGRGKPPSRLSWLVLPEALSGAIPPQPWEWRVEKGGNWRLSNPKTGESLEGYLAP